MNGMSFIKRRARHIFLQLISDLEYLHNVKHVAHRDAKAENIIFDRFDNIRLIDFGMSRTFFGERELFHIMRNTKLFYIKNN
jgi:serine/threonine protein kinase